MRAVSTVLDVAVFLLLVSVALATLAVPAADPPASTADETAETLAATTGNVTYGNTGAGGASREPTRIVSGTHAELLARGAVASLRFENASLTPATGRFGAAVREEVATVLAWSSERTAVRATWEPYPGSPLRGEIAVGAPPPPGVDVATATLTVPVPIDESRGRAANAPGDGYRSVAAVIVEDLLQTTLAVDRAGGAPAEGTTGRERARRIRAYGTALGVDEPAEGWDAARSAIERRLVQALASDLRERYDSPASAAADVHTGRVQVVVREWSS